MAAVLAVAREHGFAVLTRGAGTQDTWGAPCRRVPVVLDTRGLVGVVRHEPGDLTMRLRPGTPLRQVCDLLRPHGQTLALHPPGWARATVGGAVAGDAWGANRGTYGGPRDLTLGLRVVDGGGRAFTTGGDVVKNVSGFDVGKLFVGSFGSLGVLVEISCKLRPLPVQRAVWSARWTEATAAWDALLAITDGDFQPVAAVLVGGSGAPHAMLVLEGGREEVSDQLARLRALAPPDAPVVEALDPADGSGAGAAGGALAAALDPGAAAPALLVRCEVPEAQLRSLWTALAAGAAEGNTPSDQPARGPALTAWLGLGVLWYAAGVGAQEMPSRAKAVRALAEDLGGRAVVAAARGADPAQVQPWGDAGELLPWFQRLKQRFDPAGVLAPGRFVGGL